MKSGRRRTETNNGITGWCSGLSVLFLSFLSSKEFILQNALLTLQSASHHQVQRVQRWSGRQNSDLTRSSFLCMKWLNISKWLEVDEKQSRTIEYCLFEAQNHTFQCQMHKLLTMVTGAIQVNDLVDEQYYSLTQYLNISRYFWCW